MPTRDEDVALPPEVLAAAEELRKREGVVGVFWGDRYKESEGRWIPERTLCVHVQKKRQKDALAASEFIQPTFRGFRTDVLEVGEILAHTFDARDSVVSLDRLARKSTISAIAPIDGQFRVLLSGHGTLPLRNGRIATSYSEEDASPSLQFNDGLGKSVRGRLLEGKLGAQLPVDFALATLDVSEVDINWKHPSGEDKPPYLAYGDFPPKGMRFRHYSLQSRPQFRWGTYCRRAVTPFWVRLPDGSRHLYSNALEIEGDAGQNFSIPGDSGSLVGDAHECIVGSLLGGSTTKPLSYVLPVWSLRFYLGAKTFNKFFKET